MPPLEKPAKIQPAKIQQAKIQQVTSDLNVVLSKEQINQVLQATLGPKGQKISQIAIASDYCCVDAVVASSVAGPLTGVASSISVTDPNNKIIQANLDPKSLQLGAQHIKVTTPTNIKVK